MSSPKLTEGALLRMVNGQAKMEKPVLQILGTKKIANGASSTSSTERHRVYLSDGLYSNSFSMLATQLNARVGQLVQHCVIRVDNFVCNDLQGKKVIIILELEVLDNSVERKIGDPVLMNSDGTVDPTKLSKKRAAAEASEVAPPPAKRSPLIERSSILNPRPTSDASSSSFDPHNASVLPIAALTPYQNKWTIKVRVTKKSDIRTWSNSRGEGKLFSMDLLDESGEIRCTAFKEQVDKYFNMVEVGKLYYITSCSLKPANKQFTTLNNEYEMTFRDSTEMIPCKEDSSKIPTLSFNFVKISDLDKTPKDSVVDVMGVVKSCGDAVNLTSRAGKELTKRDVTLVDRSEADVNLTLWGSEAETFDASNTKSTVVAVKGAKVSDFNGVSISATFQSVVQVDPDIPPAHTLRGWYDAEGRHADTKSLSGREGRGQAESGMGSNYVCVAEADIDHSNPDKPAYYSTTAYVTAFRKENALYKSCGNAGNDGKTCQKKVQDQGNETYRCEKCNTVNNSFRWRIILSFSLADATGNQWATAFQEEAEKILDMGATELGNLMTDDNDRYNLVFQQACFKRLNFKMSCRPDNYNGEQRVRHMVRGISSIDVDERISMMTKTLNEAGIELPH